MVFPTRIFLTGFMGSGKSTVGPMLANVLGYEFHDLDADIEAQIGQPIATYFADHGEAAFREVEAGAVEETAALENAVIALGGGTVASGKNLDTIKRLGVLVYLKWSPEALVERLARSTDRPMLMDESGHLLPPDALDKKIRTLLAGREPYYQQADVVVSLDGFSVGWSVDQVATVLRKWVRQQRRAAGSRLSSGP